MAEGTLRELGGLQVGVQVRSYGKVGTHQGLFLDNGKGRFGKLPRKLRVLGGSKNV